MQLNRNGFAMIEVLVSVVVLAVAAVGLWVGGRSGKDALNGAVRAGG